MKVMFYIWGVAGLILNILAMLTLLAPHGTLGIGVGTSAYYSALTLIWIGGMVFFAAGYMMKPEAAPTPIPALATA
jgi:hypothetical protein